MPVVISFAKSPERNRKALTAIERELDALYNDLPAPPARKTRARVILFPGAARREPSAPPAPAKPAKRKRGASAEEDRRKDMLAKINIALRGNKKNGTIGLYQKLEHFTEEFYRDELNKRFNLQKRFGRISAADLENNELHQLLIWLSSLGFKAKRGRNRKDAPEALTHDSTGMTREERMGKIEAFLAEKGRVEGTDVPWGYAVGILKRQTANDPEGQVKNFDKASPRQLADVIAALYHDAKRRKRRVR